MVRRLCIAVILILFCSEGASSISYAGDAEVLPKGRSRVNITSINWLPVAHRYSGTKGRKGKVEEIDTDFNVIVDADVFTALGTLDGAFPGTAPHNIGSSIVDFELRYSVLSFSYQYGITDKLSAGVIIPYWKARNKAKSFLDTSGANTGKTVTGLGFGAPLAPFGTFGDETALTTEDVLQLISGGLDVNGDGIIDIDPGFGYKRFKTWHGSGIGDIEAGFKYQYLKTKNWRLAFTGGVRLPTGEVDDPDNLVDVRFFTSGAFTPLVRLHNDYTGIKNMVLGCTIKYDLVLPKQEELRITADPNRPITGNKEKVRRDQADIIEFEPSIKYTPLKGFDISAFYNFYCKYKNDRVSGDRGFAYESLERETASKSHSINIGLSFSTIPMFLEKKFPVPMSGNISYNHKFAGNDNSMKSQYVRFGLDFYF